jgi:mannosylglycoprotein endo-beta-mannosidase
MNAIRISGCVLICLQETKKDKFDLKFIKSCCTPCFDEFVYVPSAGASGGLIIIWKSSIFSGIVMHSEAYALYVYFTSTQSSQSWTLVNIYGPCHGENREKFIQWLYDLNIPDGEDWLIVGDLNFIRSPTNRNKPGGNINDMLTFNDIIHSQNLTERSIKGRKYT